jgi:hypothetical protein
MLNNKKLLTVLAVLFTCSLVPSGRDTTTCSNVVAGTNQNVKGQTTNCTGGADEGGSLTDLVGLNAFKDKVSWNAPRASKALGKITKDTNFELKYPAVGKMKVISFIPTEGVRASQKIEILFVSFSIYNQKDNLALPSKDDPTAQANLNKQLTALKDSQSSFANLIKVYRKIGAERQWEERAEIYTKENPAADKMDIMWTIMPNGMVQAVDKLYQTDINGKTTEYPGDTFDLTAME